jgi:hypothetical protein
LDEALFYFIKSADLPRSGRLVEGGVPGLQETITEWVEIQRAGLGKSLDDVITFGWQHCCSVPASR